MAFRLYNGQAWWDRAGKRSNSWLTTKYYTFNGQRIAMRDETGLYYLHRDQLGSTVLVTNNGNPIDDHGYNAYGRDRRGSELRTAQRFTGQQSDGTGLIYMNARYYDPQLGQFISPDTLVPDANNVMDFNRYMYARGNPMKYNDPSGHDGCDVGGEVVPPANCGGGGGSARGGMAPSGGSDEGALAGEPSGAIAPKSGIANNGGFLNSLTGFFKWVLGLDEVETPANRPSIVSTPVPGNNPESNHENSARTQSIKNLPNNPTELGTEWEDVTPEGMRKNTSSREYQNVKTGLRVRFDPATPGGNGYKAQDHWHVYNPDGTGKGDLYLDRNGNPVPKNSNPSHIIP